MDHATETRSLGKSLFGRGKAGSRGQVALSKKKREEK